MKLLLSEGSEKQECQIFVFKLGVEESDEKRGTSEVLRERPCSLRWLAATWGTSRISTKYGEKTEYYWITYRKVPITNVYLKVD